MHNDFWYVLNCLDNIADDYSRIKGNEEERRTSTRLGREAIKYNIAFLLMFGAAVAAAVWAASMFQPDGKRWAGILLIILALAVALTSLIFVIPAFAAEISQMKLNKKPIGLISLLLTLVIIIGGIVVIVIAFTVGF